MRRSLILLLLSAPAYAASPAPEADLVGRYLDGAVGQSALQAVTAEGRAMGTAPPVLPNPSLEARHEAAKGVAGTTTDALGGSVTLDLGFSGIATLGAARLRGRAGDHWRHAVVLDAVCEVRGLALDLWAADATADASLRGEERHEVLLQTLTALAEAGESSAYDRDRVALAMADHRVVAAQARGERDTVRARLSALVHTPVEAVALRPLPSLSARDAMRERALADHPALQALRLEYDADGRSLSAARRDAIPDLTLSGGARWDAPPDGGAAAQGFEVGGSLEIPLFDWSRASVRAASAERAATEALLAQREAEIGAAVESAWKRASALSEALSAVDPDAMWEASQARYVADETSLEDLLQIADDVQAASHAAVEHERLLRRAHLDLACASGQLSDSELQSLLEEHLR